MAFRNLYYFETIRKRQMNCYKFIRLFFSCFRTSALLPAYSRDVIARSDFCDAAIPNVNKLEPKPCNRQGAKVAKKIL